MDVNTLAEVNTIVQLEETFPGHVVQLPDLLRANQKLKHITEGHVQTALEHLQVWEVW